MYEYTLNELMQLIVNEFVEVQEYRQKMQQAQSRLKELKEKASKLITEQQRNQLDVTNYQAILQVEKANYLITFDEETLEVIDVSYIHVIK